MASSTHLTIALFNGKVVHVSEVASGAGCRCFCASCGAALVARKGAIRRHHFAHFSAGECSTHPVESAIHCLAKDLVTRPGLALELPEYILDLPIKIPAGDDNETTSPPGPAVRVDQVIGGRATVQGGACEVRVGDFRADAVVHIGSETLRKRLIIEIAVHHPCTKAKRAKIRRAGTPAIEIHLSAFAHTLINGEVVGDIEKALVAELASPENVEWLYHPGEDALRPGIALWLRDYRSRHRRRRSPEPPSEAVARFSAAPTLMPENADFVPRRNRRITPRDRLDRWAQAFQEKHGRVPNAEEYRAEASRLGLSTLMRPS